MATDYNALNAWCAFSSTVAASFSAFTAVLMLIIERRNQRESVRVDLIPLDWSRSEVGQGESKHEVIRFKKLRNFGRGAAFNVWIGSKPTGCGILIAVIAANETIDVDGWVGVCWKSTEGKNGPKACEITIHLDYTDAGGISYSTDFTALAGPLDDPDGIGGDIAPNMFWTSRKTARKVIWRQKMVKRFRKAWQSIQRKSRPNEPHQEEPL